MYPVTMLCRVLRVSRSGFYAWQQHPISPRAEETRRLDVEIKELFEASKRRSGSPKITRALIDGGWQVGENRVARRMRVLGLRSIVRRRFKVTTNSQHRFAVAPNRLQRDFTAQRPNQVWVSDLTYLSVGVRLVVFGRRHRPVLQARGGLGVELGTGSPRGAGRAAAGCSSTSSAEGPDHPLRSRRSIRLHRFH